MRDRVVWLAAALYALCSFGVVVAPSVVLEVTAADGGISAPHGIDLVIASAVIGALHATVAWRRLRGEVDVAARTLDVWIAALNALVVLALGATVLLMVVLVGFADQHAMMARRGFPVVALWAGVQLVAVALAEVTARHVFCWLQRAEPSLPAERHELAAP